MNKASKLLSLLLVLTIVFSLSVTALAADTYTITINGSGSTDKHTYEAYQIFSGDLHDPNLAKEENEPTQPLILSNIKWGSGVNTKADGFDADFPESAAKVAESLKNATDAQEFAQKIARYLSSTKYTSTGSNADNYTITNLPAGYYLVKDSSNMQGTNDFATAYMMKVVSDVTATPKGDKPTLAKEVKVQKDGKWNNIQAGYQIGDTVEFRVIASVPNIAFGYTKYTYTITDTMSSGLTSNVEGKSDISIKINDANVLDEKYYEVTVDGNAFTVAINIKAALDENVISATNALYVYYTAELNETAEYYGHDPEDVSSNTASLTYPNDPNSNSTGKTPDAVVKVWTFPTTITKVDGKEVDGAFKKLDGAKFVLSTQSNLKIEDLDLDKNDNPQNKEHLIAFYTGEGAIAPYEIATSEKIKVGTDITYVFEIGSSTIAGLGEKTYYLYEIKAPDGYNLLAEPVKFTIHMPEGDISGFGIFPSLTLGNNEEPETHFGFNIANNSGATLPETGGIGTTLFYVIGALLVVGAGVLLVTKKRMGKADN